MILHTKDRKVRKGGSLRLRLLSFEEAQAVVLEHLPGSGRNTGRMGSLRVELSNGVRFAVGTGFSDAERDNPPLVGSTIRFKHQGYTKAGVPRFASFLRVEEKF